MNPGVVFGISIIVAAIISGVDMIPKWVALFSIVIGLFSAVFAGISFARNNGEKKESKKPEEKPKPASSEEKKEEKKSETSVKKADDKKTVKQGGIKWVFLVFALILGVYCWHHIVAFGVRNEQVSTGTQEIKQEEKQEEKKAVRKKTVEDVQVSAVEIPTQADRDWVAYAVQWRKANPGVEITQKQKAALRKARQLGMLSPEQLEYFSPEDFGE